MTGVRDRQVVIVGAGLVGPLAAIVLARRGYPVRLLEQREDPRRAGTAEGRSINLAFSARGLAALDAVGLREAVEAHSVLLDRRRMHDRRGRTVDQPYGRRGQGIRSVSRGGLNVLLVEAAAAAGVDLRFQARVHQVDAAAGALILADGERVETGAHGFLVGADGAFSAVRGAMQRRERTDYAQRYLSHGYKELVMPAGVGGRPLIDPGVMHIWPRGGFMMMAMANRDGSFTVTLYLPFDGPAGFAGLQEPPAVRAFFHREFPDAVPLLPDLVEQFVAHPTGSLVTIRTAPWSVGDRTVLIGDACHAVVPFYGQGANAGFEDVLVLDQCLALHAPNHTEAFRAYERRRKVHTDALADLAVANFLEMRDRVASPMFRWKKRLERALHFLLPRAFLPLYTMVSFTCIPYAEARARARRQWRWVGGVLVVGVAAAVWGVVRMIR